MPRPAHNLRKQQLQAYSTDEEAEAQSCTHPVRILQCFPLALRVEQAPASGSCHYRPHTVSRCSVHSLCTHWAHTCPRPMLGVSPHYVSCPLIPTSSCLCGNATSSRKRPPPHANRLRLLGQLPANQYSSLHSPSCAVLPSILSHPSPLLPLTMDFPRSGKGSGPSHRILPPGGSSPMGCFTHGVKFGVLGQNATCATVYRIPGLVLLGCKWAWHRGLCD